MKITDYEISRYRLPAGKKEQLEFDDDQPGFGVHFRRSGTDSFFLQYDSGKNRKRPAIGRVGEIRAAEANYAGGNGQGGVDRIYRCGV